MPLSDDDKAELVAYLDGELDEAETQAIEAKIATDPDARAELETLKQTWGMLDFLPKTSPSPNFTNRTMERLTLERVAAPTGGKTIPVPGGSSPWPSRLAWVALILIALGGGYLASTRFWPPAQAPEPIPDSDLPLVRQLPILERWREYEHVDDLDFARQLDRPDLFGDEPS